MGAIDVNDGVDTEVLEAAAAAVADDEEALAAEALDALTALSVSMDEPLALTLDEPGKETWRLWGLKNCRQRTLARNRISGAKGICVCWHAHPRGLEQNLRWGRRIRWRISCQDASSLQKSDQCPAQLGK